MQKIPHQLHNLFRKITESFSKLLGENLVGIYISGSLTYNAFDIKSSDVDFIVILNRPMNNNKFKSLQRWLKEAAKSNKWVRRSQILFLIKKKVLVKNSSRDEFHEGKLMRGRSDANPIILLNILKSGIVLYGPKPKAFIPKITKKILHDALKLEVAYLEEGFSKKRKELGAGTLTYQVFAVLTLCRILHTYKTGLIVSKENAARWCIKNLPAPWRPIIKTALDNINIKSTKNNSILGNAVPKFVNYIGKRIK